MDHLLTSIEAFCEKHDLAESQFGVMALNDKNFVPQLREGRDIRFSTAQKVEAFMVAYRAESAAA